MQATGRPSHGVTGAIEATCHAGERQAKPWSYWCFHGACSNLSPLYRCVQGAVLEAGVGRSEGVAPYLPMLLFIFAAYISRTTPCGGMYFGLSQRLLYHSGFLSKSQTACKAGHWLSEESAWSATGRREITEVLMMST